jgi:mannitol/fructose-specific phosphotransferase system IIA component (Ntr-type)
MPLIAPSRVTETLADFTEPGLMFPALASKPPAAVIAQLCSALDELGRLGDAAAFYEAVLNREKMCPTSISPGWALPHARLKGLTQLSFALARIAQPLVWLGESGLRVQTVFLFAVPDAEAKKYLNLIAAIAQLNKNRALSEQLHRATDPKAMFEVLQQVTLRLPNLAAQAAFPAQKS